MKLRRCLICFAVLGTCFHAAHQPVVVRNDDEPPPSNPVQFVISAPITSASTASARGQHVSRPVWQLWPGCFANDDAHWAVQRNYEHRRRQVAAIS